MGTPVGATPVGATVTSMHGLELQLSHHDHAREELRNRQPLLQHVTLAAPQLA